MSRVTNTILAFSILEEEADRVGEVNAKLAETNLSRHPQDFGRPVGEWDGYGGYKFLEVPLFLAAFNHVPDEAILAAVRAARWEYPAEVQVFICGQDDDGFTLHNVFEEPS